ncbi:hypothetical protein EK904_010070, partial [Melospiza melodia maxima]
MAGISFGKFCCMCLRLMAYGLPFDGNCTAPNPKHLLCFCDAHALMFIRKRSLCCSVTAADLIAVGGTRGAILLLNISKWELLTHAAAPLDGRQFSAAKRKKK